MPSENDILRQLMPIFRDEAAEHLQAMNRILLILEKNPPAAERDSLMEGIFREAHSLKGAAKGVGLTPIAEIAHKLESIFSAVKRNELKTGPAIFDLLYTSLDTINEIMQRSLQEQAPAPIEPLLERLESVISGKEIKNPAENMGKAEVAASAHGQDSSPDLPLSEDLSAPGLIPRQTGGGQPDNTRRQPSDTCTNSKPPSTPISPNKSGEESQSKPFKLEETVRVTTTKLDLLMARMGELLVACQKTDQRLADIKVVQQGIEQWYDEWDKIKDIYYQLMRTETGRDISFILEFIEKTLTRMKGLNRQTNLLVHNLTNDIRSINLTTDDLQDEIKRVRMLPAKVIFDGCDRLVRDLARSEGKQVELQVCGAETELDKRVIEEIKDPLIHLLRNCIDHGIEKPEMRVQCGKSPKGVINLSISQRGNNIVLEVADDGAGIDIDKIKQTAVKKGFLTTREAENLSDREAHNIIFKPGFSTSPILTDVSGRGVGLDVVRENVERLHGLIDFESTPGNGCRFILTMPLTLSTAHVCLIKCEGETFAIPISAIERIVMVDTGNISSIESKMAIDLDGHPMSLLDLAEILQLSAQSRKIAPGQKLPAMVLGSAEKRLAFLVDDLIGESRVVVKNLGRQLARVPNISGATILSSGKVIMMLNVADLVKTVCHDMRGKFGLKIAAPSEDRKVNILVVDDSITTRILEKNILEAAGYEVTLASDGQEGWEAMEKKNCDLIVSDVCMPHMSGFELTSKIKQSEQYKNVPVILVTSLESKEDKERGIEVGADAYIVKNTFDQVKLLETIKRLI